MAEETELSEREREILLLVATGASNKEIASRLVISPNTVKVHLRNIFAKVGVASRTEATLYALRAGLLASPAPERPPLPPAEPTAATLPVEPAAPPVVQIPGARRSLRRIAERLLLAALLVSTALATWAALNRPAPEVIAQQPAQTSAIAPSDPERWTELAGAPALSAASGAVYENSLFLLAGEENGQPAQQAWRYDLISASWQTIAPKPTPVSHAAAALLGEKIYLAGGRGGDGTPVNALEAYDPRAGRWESRAALPAALEGHALVALDGRLYLFGGWDGARARAEVYRYDPETDQWDARAPLPSPRAYAAAAALEGKIIIAGGTDGQVDLDAADLYFPTRDQPGSDPWESTAPLPQPRSRMAAASLAGIIYFAGGTGASIPPLEYVPQSGAWAEYDPPPRAAGPLPLLLAYNTHLYLLEGSSFQSYQAIYNLSFPVIR